MKLFTEQKWESRCKTALWAHLADSDARQWMLREHFSILCVDLWKRPNILNSYIFVWVLVYVYVFICFPFVTSNFITLSEKSFFYPYQQILLPCMYFCHSSPWKEFSLCTRCWNLIPQTLSGEFLTLLLYEVTFYDGKIFKDSHIWLVVYFLYISWENKISSDELIINSILSLNILNFINHISNYLHLRSSQPYIWEAYGLFSPLAMLAMYVDSRISCPHWKLVGAGGLQVEGHCVK